MVLVINEPFVPDFCRTQRWAARTRGRVLRPPDWLAYATAVLEEAGVETELYDFPARRWDKPELRDLIRRKQPRYVVLDSTTPSAYSDIECARIAKEEAGSFVIMVGPHASALPEETLKTAAGAVDAVARGEYDYTVRDIILRREENRDLSRVKGVSYREGGALRHSGNRPLIEDLDALPYPAWHQLEVMEYFDGGKLYPYFDLISGRGCPYRCSFCLWPQVMHGRRYRLRSPRNVVDEMEYDLDRWPRLKRGEIFFEDDTFTVNRERAGEICDELLRRKLPLTWSVNARADSFDLDLFRKMKRAGCRELLVGFESGDQESLNRMKKGTTPEQGREFVVLAHRAGLVVHGCFVIGLPGETLASIERTMAYARELKLDTIQFSAAIPFPGTEYYDYCREHDLIKARSWKDWLDDGEQSTVVEYPDLSPAQIQRYVDRGLKDFYLRPAFMLRFLFQTRSFSDLYRKVRGAKNFLSYLFSRESSAK